MEDDYDTKKTKKLIAGLQNLLAGGSVAVCAEHDVLYAGHGDDPGIKEHVDFMTENGWHWDDSVDSWAFFT